MENICEKAAEAVRFIWVIGEAAQLIWSDFSAPGPILAYLYQPTSSNLGVPPLPMCVCVFGKGGFPLFKSSNLGVCGGEGVAARYARCGTCTESSI